MSSANRRPILVVDDDEPTQKLLQALMRRYGYPTETASNGREAIECLAVREYSLVILDLMMPAIGGQEVLEYLKQESRSTPVIVCTAAGPARTSTLDSPLIKAIVRKPFDIDQFASIVSSFASADIKPPRVLIVDDEPTARYLLREFIGPAEIIEAETIDEARDLIRRVHPDVVFLDLVLPGTAGETLLRELREVTDATNIPVIVVTSRAMTEQQIKELLKYAVSVIYKGNLSRDNLQELLSGVVRKATA